MSLLDGPPTVLAAGAAMFADALDDQAVPVGRVDWRPPEPGSEAALARVMADPRRASANRAAVRVPAACGPGGSGPRSPRPNPRWP